MTDKRFLLAVLSDRREHRLSEILRRSFAERGCGMTVHSRAADLRRDGFEIACWPAKKERDSFYQLIADDVSVLETATLGSGPQREPGVAVSSVDAEPPRDVLSADHRAGDADDTQSVASALTLFPTAPGAYEEPTAA